MIVDTDAPLIQRNGAMLMQRADGSYQSLYWNDEGSTVDSLVKGWRARWLYRGFAPITLIELEAADGEQATWFVDENGTRLGDHVEVLSEATRATLVAGLQSLQMNRSPEGLRRLAEYARLHAGTRLDIESLLPNPVYDRALELAQAITADAAAGKPLRPHCTLSPIIDAAGAPPRLDAALVEGWQIGKSGDRAFAFAEGKHSLIQLSGLPPSNAFYLSLVLGAVRQSRRLHVSVNDRLLAVTPLHGLFHNTQARFGYWIPPELTANGTIEIRLEHDLMSPVSNAGFILEQLRLEIAAADIPHEMSPMPDNLELMQNFQSIGDNCQFGFVQRHYGAEPIGLLRFAGMPDIVAMIEAGLAEMGAPGTLSAFVAASEYQIRESTYGLFYHTFRYENEITEAALVAENEVKLRYLARKFIEDLEDGEVIWVCRRIVSNDISEIMALHAAMRRYGPNKLLWVTPAPPDREPGEVEWLTRDLLRGYLDHEAVNDPLTFAAETWLILCQNAYRAFEAR